MPKARRKILLFLVEGPSDADALGLGLSRLFADDDVELCVTDGDVTTRTGSRPDNIKAKIGDYVRNFAGHTYRQSDFLKVVHLLDTDGAYVSKERIVKMDDEGRKAAQAHGGKHNAIYLPGSIQARNISQILDRNMRKRAVLEVLRTTRRVWRTVPYEAYYFSCNLDHVLYGDPNFTPDQKCTAAATFSERCAENAGTFRDFFLAPEIAAPGDYVSSWKYIAQGTRSLERRTNFGLFLQEAGKALAQ